MASSSAEDMPSYARPTASSKAKANEREISPRTSAPSSTVKKKHTNITRPLPVDRPRRKKAPSFLDDLPADVRNIIYGFVVPERLQTLRAYVRLAKNASAYQQPETYLQGLPSLLCVKNKQIREEAGSFYFNLHRVVLRLDHAVVRLFCAEMGRVNCQRFLANQGAKLLLPEKFHCYGPCRSESLRWTEVMQRDLIRCWKLWSR